MLQQWCVHQRIDKFLSGSDYIHFYIIVMNSFYDAFHDVDPSLVIVLRPSEIRA